MKNAEKPPPKKKRGGFKKELKEGLKKPVLGIVDATKKPNIIIEEKDIKSSAIEIHEKELKTPSARNIEIPINLKRSIGSDEKDPGYSEGHNEVLEEHKHTPVPITETAKGTNSKKSKETRKVPVSQPEGSGLSGFQAFIDKLPGDIKQGMDSQQDRK